MITNLRQFICINLVSAFFCSSLYVPDLQAGEMVIPILPAPGTMVNLSHAYSPAYLKGIIIHPGNALQFDFLIDKGDGNLTNAEKMLEYNKLVKYFLASLTVPDKDQWVNLSPYEKGRIIEDDFGKTTMGRDLLAQDYILKQITSSLMYPESSLGKSFWNKVYQRAHQEYGSTDIPVNTFNKVWIVPDQAVIYESGNTAYVVKNHLKVMLEEDYLSLEKHNGIAVQTQGNNLNALQVSKHALASQVIREIILPELETEVNEGKNFAMLRQITSGMILATWYKKTLKKSLLGKIYADKTKVKGIDQDPKNNEVIYREYLAAFKKGVYNYIKEDFDQYSRQTVPRKYFAGGYSDKYSMVTTSREVDKAQLAVKLQNNFIDVATVALGAIGSSGTANPAKSQSSPDNAQISNYDLNRLLAKIRDPKDFPHWFMTIHHDIPAAFKKDYGEGIDLPPEAINLMEGQNVARNNRVLDAISNAASARTLHRPYINISADWRLLFNLAALYYHYTYNYPNVVNKNPLNNAENNKLFKDFNTYLANQFLNRYPFNDLAETEVLQEFYQRPDPRAVPYLIDVFYTEKYKAIKSGWHKTIIDGLRGSVVKLLVKYGEDYPQVVAFVINTFHDSVVPKLLKDELLIAFGESRPNDEMIIREIGGLLNFELSRRIALEYFFRNKESFTQHIIKILVPIINGAILLEKENFTPEEMAIANNILTYFGVRLQEEQHGSIKMPVLGMKGALAFFPIGWVIKRRIQLEKETKSPATKNPSDQAMAPGNLITPGGIDMNSANLNLQIKRDGQGVPLPLVQQDMGQLSRIQGLEPIIIEIKPASSLALTRHSNLI